MLVVSVVLLGVIEISVGNIWVCIEGLLYEVMLLLVFCMLCGMLGLIVWLDYLVIWRFGWLLVWLICVWVLIVWLWRFRLCWSEICLVVMCLCFVVSVVIWLKCCGGVVMVCVCWWNVWSVVGLCGYVLMVVWCVWVRCNCWCCLKVLIGCDGRLLRDRRWKFFMMKN